MELRNRFKGPDLIECLMNCGWRLVTLYRRQGSRPSKRIRNAKKKKWLSGRPVKREVKSKGDKQRYTHLNAELQRIARKDKKALLNDQCKEIKENKRMGARSQHGESHPWQRS